MYVLLFVKPSLQIMFPLAEVKTPAVCEHTHL
jgi:hypothetical protein